MSSKVPFFPPWFDQLMLLVGLLVVGGLVYLTVFALYATSPKTTHVGYMPEQPVPYSHALHVGKLGLDCRYCHNTVEKAAFAAIPPTQTCMNCHSSVRTTSSKLEPVRASYSKGLPLEWVQVHDLPDFVYFNHSAHVGRDDFGIGCVSCHGRVDQMETVHQVEFLSMGWCLECHRNPEEYLRPRSEVTNMLYEVGNQKEIGQRLKDENSVRPPTDCYGCHR
ncbi:MAG: cytochrome c family protein [bacterium]|nr:cytochrome c family protein [bacterium]